MTLPPRPQGLCKIVTDLGFGLYHVIQVFWDGDDYIDADGTNGFLTYGARDIQNRPGIAPDTIVHFWFQQRIGYPSPEVVIDSGQHVCWGVLTADWDVNTCPDKVTVNQCDRDGGNVVTGVSVDVYLVWPEDDTKPLGPEYWSLKTDVIIAYVPIADAEDDTKQGIAFPVRTAYLWGKLTVDWVDGDNFVTVRLCDETGTEIGYTPDVKCWLFSPESLDGDVHGATLKQDDLIRIETPKRDAVSGDVVAHALNVSASGGNKLLDGTNHTDTKDHDPAAGDIIFAGADAKWDGLAAGANYSILTISGAGLPAWLAPGANNTVLKTVGGALVWGAGTNAPQALLDGVNHNDTDNYTPVAGDLVAAHGSPAKWGGLSIGETNAVMSISSAGVPSWTGAPSGEAILRNTAAGVLSWLSVGDPQSILYAEAGGAIAWLPKGANDSMLTTDGAGALAWQDIDQTVQDAASRMGEDGGTGGASGSTAVGAANAFARHWVPTGAGTKHLEVIPGDARGHLIRYWMSCGINSIADCQHGADGTRTGLCVVTGAAPSVSILGVSDSSIVLQVNPTTKALEIVMTKVNAGADSVYFFVRVDDFGVIPAAGYTDDTQDP